MTQLIKIQIQIQIQLILLLMRIIILHLWINHLFLERIIIHLLILII